MKNLNLPVQRFDVEELTKRCPYIVQGDLSGLRGGQPRLLIGQCNCVSKEMIEIGATIPVLSRNKLGWVFHGSTPFHCDRDYGEVFVNFCCTHGDDQKNHIKGREPQRNERSTSVSQTVAFKLRRSKAQLRFYDRANVKKSLSKEAAQLDNRNLQEPNTV
jgi:hypothetical protein